MPRHHSSKYLGDMDANKYSRGDQNFEHKRDCVIARNENTDGPNLDEHEEDCRCFNCEMNRKEKTRQTLNFGQITEKIDEQKNDNEREART